jgi:hypothetical protein
MGSMVECRVRRGFVTQRGLLALILSAASAAAIGDDGTPNKSGYTLFDPTPDADLRSFNTDRPPKANSPYTVDAGHFQYETDIAAYGYGNTGGAALLTTVDSYGVICSSASMVLVNPILSVGSTTAHSWVLTGIADSGGARRVPASHA